MKKYSHINIVKIIGMCIVIFFVGCVEEFEANVSDIVTEGLVVEGDIISDSIVVFKLSRMLPLTETEDTEDLFTNYLVSNADLVVKGDDGSSWNGYSYGIGEYQVQIGTLDPNVKYYLEIKYDGDSYQSDPQAPLACSEIERLTFSQSDLSGPVTIRLDSKETDLTETKYYLWYFEEDWEIRTHFASKDLYDPNLNTVVSYPFPPVAQGWCSDTADKFLLGTTESTVENRIVGKPIRVIEATDNRISVLYSIRVQQRNLSRQEYEYYQVRAKLNSEMGGLFTPQPSELPTNITCSNPKRKAIGYVGCNMGVADHQLYISGEDVSYLDEFSCDVGEDPAGSYSEKYAAGFQIGSKMLLGNQSIIEWVRIKCADVRSLGADPMGRPEWWPNPYLYYKE